MKNRKIRGLHRKHSEIENWKNYNLNLKTELLDHYKREYADIIVHPWCDLSIINSQITEPKGKVKQNILSGLFEIYHSWKVQLDAIGKPYYLKLWLFEPRFSNSQIVCAIDDNIDFYQNGFFKPELSKQINPNIYGKLKDKIETFTWQYYYDEDHFTNDDLGKPEDYINQKEYEESKRWFDSLMKKPHRTAKFDEPIGTATESYSFKKGDLWVGGL